MTLPETHEGLMKGALSILELSAFTGKLLTQGHKAGKELACHSLNLDSMLVQVKNVNSKRAFFFFLVRSILPKGKIRNADILLNLC